jgi:hypothetical protein
MKKKYSLYLILFIGIVFSSCRKEYTCACTADDPIHNVSFTAEMTKSAAEDWCVDLEIENIFREEPIEGWRCDLKGI